MNKFTDGAVVTANFIDRQSDYPWLIRAKNQNPKDAIPVKAITATGVEFKQSDANGYERNFGCTMVANCATAEDHATDPTFDKGKVIRLQFCGLWFENADTGERVEKLDTLYLTSDHHMHGIPATTKVQKVVGRVTKRVKDLVGA